MNLNVFTTSNNESFKNVIKGKEGYIASNSYILVLTKDYQGEPIENTKIEAKYMEMLNTVFSDSSKEEYKLSEITDKEELVECGCCHGSGYEKPCPCGVSTEGYLIDVIMNGSMKNDFHCIYCEDSGVVAADSSEDEGAYTCTSCNGTGKITAGYFERTYKVIGTSHVSDDNLQKIYHYLGDATFYPTKNPLAPIYFDGEGFEGVVMPLIPRDEEEL